MNTKKTKEEWLDNEIRKANISKKIKNETYTKEEVDALCEDAYRRGHETGFINCEKFISSNKPSHTKSDIYDICKNCGEKYPFKTEYCRKSTKNFNSQNSQEALERDSVFPQKDSSDNSYKTIGQGVKWTPQK
jgi:hypothetical protein